eukprot:TRINITY_DN30193_c0_g1_i2.p1 TRINITY_DN30193_c0_g1~~TRINITY_DN30193_c0_g1_i2.p1  ORF type:complete len:474 (+),score=112.52 TRINITY_DN30193_c0_g1_i2:104-1423(+)
MPKRAPHVAVIGGGVIGVSCCHELLLRGCQVTLIERSPAGVALKGSFQNGNYLNSQWAPPMASPAFPGEFLRSVRGTGQFLPLETSPFEVLRPRFLRWCAHLVSAFRRHDELAAAGSALARDTIARIHALREEHAELRAIPLYRGVLSLVGSEQEAAARKAEGKTLLSKEQISEQEPLLGPLVKSGRLHGAALNTSAMSLDCHEWSTALHKICAERLGLQTRLGCGAESLVTDSRSKRCVGVQLEGGGELQCDAVVVALGCEARDFLRPYAQALPIIPVGGYSLDWRPDGPVLRTYAKVALLKGLGLGQFGDRLRMSGLVHFGGGTHHQPGEREAERVAGLLRARVLARCGLDLAPVLPKPGDGSGAICWACFRPCTPDNLPLVGHLPPLENLYVCGGHSFSGWGWSLASAALLADAVAGERRSTVDPAPFDPGRFGWA